MRVTLVTAMSADGKIAPADRTPVRFGSADWARLEQACAAADALVIGAGTLRAHGTTVPIREANLLAAREAAGRPAQPLTCIVSGSGRIDPAWPVFATQEGERAVATLGGAVESCRRALGARGDVWDCGDAVVSPTRLVERLAARGCAEVVLLGGGNLNATFAAAGLIHRVLLTIAPLAFGGAAAPTWLDGPGLEQWLSLAVERMEVVDACIFVDYRVAGPVAEGET